MKSALVVLVISLVAAMSVPHVSLWGISFGTGVVEAADLGRTYSNLSPQFETQCQSAYSRRCIRHGTGPQYSIGHCENGLWKMSGRTYDSFLQCVADCTGTDCREPYVNVASTIANGGQLPSGQSATITYSRNPNIPSNVVNYLRIKWKTPNGQEQINECATNSCSQVLGIGSPGDISAGATVQYWAEMNLRDGTNVRNPSQETYSFRIAATQSAPSQLPASDTTATSPGGMTDQTGTITVRQTTTTSTGGAVAVTFLVGSSVTSVTYQLVGPTTIPHGTATCIPVAGGKSCLDSLNLQAGSYTITASDNTGISLGLNPNPFPFTVSSSGGAGDTGSCCVVQKGLEYFYYPEVTSRETCRAKQAETGGTDHNFYATSSCAAAQHTVCDTFCKNEQDTTGGNCGFSSTRQTSSQFERVCESGSCRCGAGGSRDYRDVPCDQACLTPSQNYFYSPNYIYSSSFGSAQRATIPFGQCSSNPQALIAAWSFSAGAVSTGQYVQRPYPIGRPGEYQCSRDETCVCTFVDFSSFSARPPTTSVPGSVKWNAPDAIKNIVPKQPNERDCDAASGATITASFGGAASTGSGTATAARLIQAGDSVTITGKVGKLSEGCKGYNFTCRTEVVQQCDAKNRVLWTTLDYKDCPAGTTQVHAEGGGRKYNWRLITAIGIAAATWGIGALAGGAATTTNIPSQYLLVPAETGVAASTPAWATALQGAAYAQLGGSALDGLNCGTPREGSGEAAANMLYYFTSQLGRDCGDFRNARDCRADGCLWENNECFEAPKTGNPTAQQCSQCAAQGYAGICTDTGSCTNSGQCQRGQFYSCSGTTSSGCPAGEECTLRLCGSAGGSQADCSVGGSAGLCCKSSSGARTVAPATGDCTVDSDCANGACDNWFCVQNNNAQCTTACKGFDPANTRGTCETSQGGFATTPAGTNGCVRGYHCNCYRDPTTGRATASPIGVTGYATRQSKSQAAGQIATNLLNLVPACPSAEDRTGCFNVCGRVYNAPVSAAPVCDGPVINVQDASYKCPAGDCGAYAEKRVKVVIRAPDGTAAVEDFTTTDGNGEFSYTFVAPAADGEFTAILSVPKDE